MREVHWVQADLLTCLFSSSFLKMDWRAMFCFDRFAFEVSFLLLLEEELELLRSDIAVGSAEERSSRSSRDFSREPCGFKMPPLFSEPMERKNTLGIVFEGVLQN